MRKQIISLGKALVKELELDQSFDTLVKWMAHYVAEQIKIAENDTGDDKSEAEKRCFETILKLWQHRSSLPNGRNPFENFEPIFRTLERLNPDNDKAYYFHESKDDNINIKEDVQQWLDMALDIDQVVRIWLNYVIEQAALSAADDNTTEWLKNSVVVADHDSDFSIIIRLLPKDDLEGLLDDRITSLEKIRQEKRELISERIKKLEAFNDFNQQLLSIFRQELEEICLDEESLE